jgi:hypothetical protein
MKWGKRLEDDIADEYADRHPETAVRTTGMWRNRERPWQVVSPDRFLYPAGRRRCRPTGLLEIKNSIDGLGWGEPGTDEIPVYYRCQVLWYLDGLGAETGNCPDEIEVAVLISGWDYQEYRVKYDPAEARILRDAGQEFLATVAAGQRPNVDGHAETYRLIREMHPEIEPYAVDLPAGIAGQYLAANAAHKTAEAAKRQATAAVADLMGNAHRAQFAGTTIATRRPGKAGGNPYVCAVPVKEPGQKVSAA